MFQSQTFNDIAKNTRRKHPDWCEAKINNTVKWILAHPNYNGYYKAPTAEEKIKQKESEVRQIAFDDLLKGCV